MIFLSLGTNKSRLTQDTLPPEPSLKAIVRLQCTLVNIELGEDPTFSSLVGRVFSLGFKEVDGKAPCFEVLASGIFSSCCFNVECKSFCVLLYGHNCVCSGCPGLRSVTSSVCSFAKNTGLFVSEDVSSSLTYLAVASKNNIFLLAEESILT
jgi:hypothetical protein